MAKVNYKVTCEACGGSSLVELIENALNKFIAYQKTGEVISARPRLDGYWGFQCICGNNSLLSEQENRLIKDKVNPSPKDIQAVMKSLEQPSVIDEGNTIIVDNFRLAKV